MSVADNRIIRATAAAFLATAIAACSGNADKSGQSHDDSVAVETETILSEPPRFNAATIDSLAYKVENGHDFGLDELARMITLCEATANRIQPELERLQMVDDPADTYETLTDMSKQTWYRPYLILVEYLTNAPLPPEFDARVAQLLNTNKRVKDLLEELTERDLKGQAILQM